MVFNQEEQTIVDALNRLTAANTNSPASYFAARLVKQEAYRADKINLSDRTVIVTLEKMIERGEATKVEIYCIPPEEIQTRRKYAGNSTRAGYRANIVQSKVRHL